MSYITSETGEDENPTIDPKLLDNLNMSGNYQNPLQDPDMSANGVHNIEPYLPPTPNVPLDTYPPVEPVAAVNHQGQSNYPAQLAGHSLPAIPSHNHNVTEHARDYRWSQDQTMGRKRDISGSGRDEEQLHKRIRGPEGNGPGLPDGRAISFCHAWFGHYHWIRPGNNHFDSLATLTGLSPIQIQTWYNSNFRSRNDPHRTLRSSSSGFQRTDDGSTLPTSIQDSYSADTIFSWAIEADHASQYHPIGGRQLNAPDTNIEADDVSQSHLIAQSGGWQPNAPDTNIEADEVLDAALQPEPDIRQRALDKAALEARDRGRRCKRINTPDLPEGDPSKSFQCTWKCGKIFPRKGDWERHETIRNPQHGWVCMISDVYCKDANRYCAYCEHPYRDPTPNHVKEAHKKCFHFCRGGENPFCESVFFRREHFNQHFSQIHPALNPNDYVDKYHFQVRDSAFSRWCGFCACYCQFLDFKGRNDHIAKHFQENKCMRDWQEPSSEAEDEASINRGDDDSDHDNYSEEDIDDVNSDQNSRNTMSSSSKNAGFRKEGYGPPSWKANTPEPYRCSRRAC